MTDINNWIQSDDELFIKNVMLTTEFNKYLLEHPEELDKIPDNANVVILPADDPEFCRKMIALTKQHQQIDDMKDRPIIFVKVEKMAPPPPSRFTNLEFEKDVKTICY
jgi:hypothetical protein